MARAKTKEDLLRDSVVQYDKLMTMVNGMTLKEQEAEFLFEDRDKNLRDVLAHLHEWHNMMERWYKEGVLVKGMPDVPRKCYNWRTIPEMNQVIWQEYQDVSLEETKVLLAQSHEKMLGYIEERTNEELFEKKVYPFTKSTTLGAYFVSACPSHYDWAMKKIKKQIKLLKEAEK